MAVSSIQGDYSCPISIAQESVFKEQESLQRRDARGKIAID